MTCSCNSNSTNRRGIAKYWPWFVLVGLIAMLANDYAYSSETRKDPGKTEVAVYKSPACGCCDKWVAHLRENDFKVEVNVVPETNSVRARVGVPNEMASCHTAVVGDYWVEGHVPADLIHKLLAEQPEGIRGIAAPGMPQGSPGMESPTPSEYQVFSVNAQGEVEVFAIREGQNAH